MSLRRSSKRVLCGSSAAALSLCVLGLSGCPRAVDRSATTEQDLPASLLSWAAPPRELTFERKRVVSDVGLPWESVRQRWSEALPAGDSLHYDVVTGVDEPDAPQVVQRFAYGQAGVAIIAEGPMVDGQASLEPWLPPMLLLPVDPKVGATWEDRHEHGSEVVKRTCEILASDQCSEGLVSVCDREHPMFRLVTRDHFCPSEGWAGYESLLVREGEPSIRTWTEGLRRVL
ncbi:MAG: hypothetical protein EA397_08125 [Deltaproteobacteria bacterium]|nr:MAG: hypothetical protein EA397_08125 [Deltaproteobacteria bacterium]